MSDIIERLRETARPCHGHTPYITNLLLEAADELEHAYLASGKYGRFHVECSTCKALFSSEQVLERNEVGQRKVREEASKFGWTFGPPDSDYCPACSKAVAEGLIK